MAARGRQSWTSPRQPSVLLSPPLDHFLPLLLAYSRFPSEVLAMIMTGFISITEARRASVCYNRHTRPTRGIFHVSPATVKGVARHKRFLYRMYENAFTGSVSVKKYKLIRNKKYVLLRFDFFSVIPQCLYSLRDKSMDNRFDIEPASFYRVDGRNCQQ